MMAAKKKEKPIEAQEIKEVALKNILDVLKGDKEFNDKTQLAMKFLNYVNKEEHIKQTKVKFQFTLVKSLADPDVMRKYILSSEPSIKKLPA